MDRGAWQAMDHTVSESQTQQKRLSMHAHFILNQKVTPQAILHSYAPVYQMSFLLEPDRR